MFIAYVVIAVLLPLILLPSAYGKLTKDKRLVESMTSSGVPLGLFPFLAACLIAGAVGLLAGIWLGPLGVAAAVGLALYFVGAAGVHLRIRDLKGAVPALVILVLAVAAIPLRAGTL